MSSSSHFDQNPGGPLPDLGDGVLLFVFRPDPTAEPLRSLYKSWLSDEELERFRRYRFDRHRDEFLHGRALTRYVLAHYLGLAPRELRFGQNAYGKPHVEPAGGIHFNLSHTQGLNVLALSRLGPIGVDVEYADPRRAGEDISQRYFTAQEHRRLLCSAPEDRAHSFFSTWTLKESFVKAVGQGLSLSLSSFAFEIERAALRLSLSQDVPAAHPWHSELLLLQPELLCAWTLGARGAHPPSTLVDIVPAAQCTPAQAQLIARGGTHAA